MWCYFIYVKWKSIIEFIIKKDIFIKKKKKNEFEEKEIKSLEKVEILLIPQKYLLLQTNKKSFISYF